MSLRFTLDRWLPRLVLSPTLFASLVFVYGFIILTAYLSFSASRLMPNFEFAGLTQYQALWDNDRWWTSVKNLFIFGSLFIGISIALGLFAAILLDQKIRVLIATALS